MPRRGVSPSAKIDGRGIPYNTRSKKNMSLVIMIDTKNAKSRDLEKPQPIEVPGVSVSDEAERVYASLPAYSASDDLIREEDPHPASSRADYDMDDEDEAFLEATVRGKLGQNHFTEDSLERLLGGFCLHAPACVEEALMVAGAYAFFNPDVGPDVAREVYEYWKGKRDCRLSAMHAVSASEKDENPYVCFRPRVARKKERPSSSMPASATASSDCKEHCITNETPGKVVCLRLRPIDSMLSPHIMNDGATT